jgi:pimeloyl-ACP methyl ester carboxylesterase
MAYALIPGAGGSAWYWHRVAPPTRVIQGSDDRLFPLEFQREVVRSRLGLELEVMPGGHLVALSQPEELVSRILAGV